VRLAPDLSRRCGAEPRQQGARPSRPAGYAQRYAAHLDFGGLFLRSITFALATGALFASELWHPVPAQLLYNGELCVSSARDVLQCVSQPATDWVWRMAGDDIYQCYHPGHHELRFQKSWIGPVKAAAIRAQIGKVLVGSAPLESEPIVTAASIPVAGSFRFVLDSGPKDAAYRFIIGYMTPSRWILFTDSPSSNESLEFSRFVSSFRVVQK